MMYCNYFFFFFLIAISAKWQAEMHSAFLPGGVRFGMVAEIQNPYLYSKTLLPGL